MTMDYITALNHIELDLQEVKRILDIITNNCMGSLRSNEDLGDEYIRLMELYNSLERRRSTIRYNDKADAVRHHRITEKVRKSAEVLLKICIAWNEVVLDDFHHKTKLIAKNNKYHL